ncbi:hypothetical protein [Ascidiimonas sp. W6]|uniref:hypothetical protein n=1 Tax=Ascidiimonas meishanensis TaxID=3128903 RepID=UPI0030EF1176
MKKLPLFLFLLLLYAHNVSGQSVFELSPSQSMSITGKGSGKDAALNPYSNDDRSIAIIENIGENDVVIRIQEKGKVIERSILKPAEIKKMDLLKEQELYLDSELKSKASVDFQAKAE